MDLRGVVDNVVRTIQSVGNMINEDTKTKSELKNGLEYLRCEMEMIEIDIEKYEELQLQELSYEIEDFLYGLWTPGAYGFILSALGMEPRAQELNRVSYFKERIQSLRKWLQGARSSQSQDDGSTATSDLSAGSTPVPEFAASQRLLVGYSEPKRELLEQLAISSDGGESHQPRIITVVGCRGVGKTALVRAVYDDPHIVDEFSCRAWVKASYCNCSLSVGEILTSILQQVRPEQAGEAISNTKQLRTAVHEFLRDKRYLVVVEDVMQSDVWDNIKHVFPQNNAAGNRIIVTTSIQKVAKSFCSGSYRIVIRGLDDAESKELFWREVFGCQRELAPDLVYNSDGILRKCDGLPSALVSIAKYLGRKVPDLTGDDCKTVCQTLGNFLAGKMTDSAFGEIRKALAQCYDSLPDRRHKKCLLSVSMFPKGHLVNMKSLARRCIAEGLIVRARDDLRSEEVNAIDHLQKLINQSLIEPARISDNNVVKWFKVHGIMLEFIIHKAISQNFTTLIHEDCRLPVQRSSYAVHRLSIHDGTQESARLAEKTGLSYVRSLAICNNSPIDFKTCKLLRVLDLERCKELHENVLENICRLEFLRYLSLRGTDVDRIPMKISELLCLETLDIRETRVEMLPLEVIMLPQLAHLFGRFKLPQNVSLTSKDHCEKCSRFFQFVLQKEVSLVCECFCKKSRLQTLAGVVTDSTADKCLQHILCYARQLRKMKIWYEKKSSPPQKKAKNSGYSDTPAAPMIISALESRLSGSRALESLSIDSGDLARSFRGSYLKAPCALTSLKLRGGLDSLPDADTLHALRSLSRLKLFSTGLTSEALSVLQCLPCLVYLTLDEGLAGFQGASFVVERGGFPSLHRLCFHGRRLPRVCIEQGAMGSLTSLHLLCSEVEEGLGVEGISHLQHINEVVLHDSTSDTSLQAWKVAATQHKNRPHVMRQQKPVISNRA